MKYYELILLQEVYSRKSKKVWTSVSLKFTHDDASLQTAALEGRNLNDYGIEPPAWPSFSSNVSPVGNIWGLIKTYTKDHFKNSKGGRQCPRAVTKSLYIQSQHCFTGREIFQIFKCMHDRCEAVILAQGGTINY